MMNEFPLRNRIVVKKFLVKSELRNLGRSNYSIPEWKDLKVHICQDNLLLSWNWEICIWWDYGFRSEEEYSFYAVV